MRHKFQCWFESLRRQILQSSHTRQGRHPSSASHYILQTLIGRLLHIVQVYLVFRVIVRVYWKKPIKNLKEANKSSWKVLEAIERFWKLMKTHETSWKSLWIQRINLFETEGQTHRQNKYRSLQDLRSTSMLFRNFELR